MRRRLRLGLLTAFALVTAAGAIVGARAAGLVGARDDAPRDTAAADATADEDPACVAARVGLPCR